MKYLIPLGILVAGFFLAQVLGQECGTGPVEGSCAACHKYWPCDPGRKV